MKRPRLVPAIRHTRAEVFTEKARENILDWDVRAGAPAIVKRFDGTRPIPTVEFELRLPGVKRPQRFSLSVGDAEDIKSQIEHAIDAALGI